MLIPVWARNPLAVGVPLLEMSIATAWLLGLWRSAMLVALMIFLLVFTGAYGWHLAVGQPPDCHCLGEWMAYDRMQTVSHDVVWRNGALIVMLASGMILGRAGSAGPDRVPRLRPLPWSPRCLRRRPGFTLVETLLSIALVAILIGLILPSLTGLRNRAHELTSLAQLRSHAQLMHVYTNDYRGYFPIYSSPDGETIIRGGGRAIPIQYFFDRFLWTFAMSDEYYDGHIGHPSFIPPGYQFNDSPYEYTVSYLATPEFWNHSTRTGPEQWKGVIADRTAWPDAKGLLISEAAARIGLDRVEFTPDTPRETAFVDGSARVILHGNLNPPIVTGEGRWPGRVTVPFGLPVIHTVDGALGRDVR